MVSVVVPLHVPSTWRPCVGRRRTEDDTDRMTPEAGTPWKKGVQADFRVRGQEVDGEIDTSEREDIGFQVGPVGS